MSAGKQVGVFQNRIGWLDVFWPDILRGEAESPRQMIALWTATILPLRSIAPVACGYWAWRVFQGVSGRPPQFAGSERLYTSRAKYLAVLGAQKLCSFWLGIEVMFLVFFLYKRRCLELHAAKPPRIPSGAVLPMLRRMFQATEDIQAGGKVLEPESRPSAGFRTPVTPKSLSIADMRQSGTLQKNESNVEELLRGWDSLQRDSRDHDSPSTEAMIDDAEILALKQAEVSGWFVQRCTGSSVRWPAARVREIRRGNMEEFLAFAFFHCNPEELSMERRKQMDQLLAEGTEWVGLDFEPGYNEDVQPMRVTMDRIISEHRPFLFYAVTALVLPFVTERMIGRLGFTRYSSGTMSYWHYPAGGVAKSSHHKSDSSMPPIVFIHGLGINVLPYFFFISELMKLAGDRTIFLVSLPHISMRLQEHVPSCAEMVACLSDMLASWGHLSAHFVGHSFGTLPLAWMVKLAPSRVSMVTFIDPVCFLIIKPDVCYNFIYRRPSTPAQLMTSFFVARELFIANSLSRNFFWFNNALWPEDVTMPSLVVLSGQDAIVPSHSVRRYLSVYKQRYGLDSLKVIFNPDLSHGEACLPGNLDAGRAVLRDMLLMDSIYSAPGVQRAASAATSVSSGD